MNNSASPASAGPPKASSRNRRGLRLGLLALALLGLVAAFAVRPGARLEAQSIGISPGSVEVEDALRGGEYVRSFSVINQRPDELTFFVAVAGEVGPWLELQDPADLEGPPVESVTVPPNSEQFVNVKVTVPSDAGNRRYMGQIQLRSTPPDPGDDGSGVGVGTGVILDVTVDVTGTQVLDGTVTGVTTNDTEVGQPLRVRLDFENTGNVVAEPVIHLAITNAVGDLVGEATVRTDTFEEGHDHEGEEGATPGAGTGTPPPITTGTPTPATTGTPSPEVTPAEGEEDSGVPPVLVDETASLSAEWDTTGQEPGPYSVEVSVLLLDEEIHSESFPFELLPEGTFTREGELLSLELVNVPDPGAVALLSATFRNSGMLDALVKFSGEVYRDGQLVAPASSDELLVEAGQVGELSIFVPVEERGEYTVRGLLNYEGKETATMEIVFKVPSDLGSDSVLALPPWWQMVAGGLLAAMILGGVVVESRRLLRRRKGF